MSSVGEPCLNSEGTLFMSLAARVKHRPMKNVLCALRSVAQGCTLCCLVSSLRTKVTFGLQGLPPSGFWKNEGMNDIHRV